MLELAILGAVSASWSLSKDIYAFVRNAKNAGCDIEDLDHKINNDRLLLERYLHFFEAHLEHFNDEEQSHLQATFECIRGILLKRNNTIQWYRQNGKTERAIWAVLGSELEADEKKLAAWVSGLQSWLTFVPEIAKKELSGKAVVRPVMGTILIPTDLTLSRGPRSIPVTSELIGSGSYANVYQVSLGQYYQMPKSDDHLKFAVKTFHSTPWTKRMWERESATHFAMTRSSHDHLLPLLDSWSDDRGYHLLLPLAQSNLRSLLLGPPPRLDAALERWLLTQFRGLADGLRHIHEVHDPDDRFPQRLSGIHHDLKPENILVFKSGRVKISDFGAGALGERTEILKIADFGSAKISLFSKRVCSGTPVYDGPEVESQGLVSQPADMWSLGCILLEMLAWSVRPPGYSPLDFHYSRVMTLKTEDDESGERLAQLNAPFWSKDSRGKIIVHPAVVNLLRQINGLLPGGSWLRDSIEPVEQLLSIEPRARPTARALSQFFNHVLTAAARELSTNIHDPLAAAKRIVSASSGRQQLSKSLPKALVFAEQPPTDTPSDFRPSEDSKNEACHLARNAILFNSAPARMDPAAKAKLSAYRRSRIAEKARSDTSSAMEVSGFSNMSNERLADFHDEYGDEHGD